MDDEKAGEARSFFVSYWASPGNFLLGGLKYATTHRYQHASMARTKMFELIRANGGDTKCHAKIIPSDQHPQIFVHCGDITTTYGTKCPTCQRLMTIADAIEARAVDA